MGLRDRLRGAIGKVYDQIDYGPRARVCPRCRRKAVPQRRWRCEACGWKDPNQPADWTPRESD